MSWSGVGEFFGRDWVRKQSPVVIFSVVILFMLYRLIFVSFPNEREADRELLTSLTTISNTNIALAIKEFKDECKSQRDFYEKRYLVQDEKQDKLIEKMLKIENNNNNILGDFDRDKFMRETREAVIKMRERAEHAATDMRRDQHGHFGAGHDYTSEVDGTSGVLGSGSGGGSSSTDSAVGEDGASAREDESSTALPTVGNGPN